MLFETVPLRDARGAILAHGVRVGGKFYRKGRVLSDDDLALLLQENIGSLSVARLEANDIPEDEAAAHIASKLTGPGIRAGAAFTGRANLYATAGGVLVVDAAQIDAVNAVDEAVTLATLAPYTAVTPGQMLATVKIIPFAAPKEAVEKAELLLANGALKLSPFLPHRAALISTSTPGLKESLLDKNRTAIEARLNAVGSLLVFERRVSHEPEALAAAISEAKKTGCDPILIFGASAITDRRDVIPAALEIAGGRIEHFGMPVDPGNLLLIGTLGDAKVVGLPGCARSPKLNGFDFVLWRMAAGLPIGRKEIAAMGVGGLLMEIPSRPQPRDEPLAVSRAPKIAAVVLAAGMSSRMGSNKLLADVNGKPMVRNVVDAAIASQAGLVIVVTGNNSEAVRETVRGLNIQFRDNPDFSKGLSTSLRLGIKSVPADYDGAMILLGDMPGVSPALIDKLIAAFDPVEDRAICVATRHGKQGNPVLWARRFFPEMLAIEGDVGARNLIGMYGELVCEVEADDDAPLTDIDTPQALEAYRAR
ncbi:MAG TPA: molybdopterin-binding/glycosyltransferase family 2 protein [Rhizomicrobium sp.]|nr:molybdopterin-binding/glycosyltransferase family 2 protein [Rhizomicrobium sp.]